MHTTPRFACRTDWTTTPNRLAEAWGRCRALRADAIDLTSSNPTEVELDYPRDEILEALADPRALRYEPEPCGLRSARDALALDCARAGAPVSAEDLILSASTSEAYAWLFRLLAEPGDEVLVPRPSYPLLEYLSELQDVTLCGYPLEFDGAWSIDLDRLADAITPRTRAVVVIHPNNPTGHFVRRGESAALGELCAERGLALISDEVFLEFALDAAPPSRAGSLAAEPLPCLTFSLGGLSKSAALPQLKLAWTRLGGPTPLRDEARTRLEVIADTFLSVNTPVQWALPTLLRSRATVVDQIRARANQNLGGLRDAIGVHSALTLLPIEAGWSAVLRLPRVRSEEEWTLRLIEEEALFVHPGYFFDFAEEAYWILSLLTPPARLAPAIARIVEFVERHR